MLNWLVRYAVPRELLLDAGGQAVGSLLDVGCGPHGFACVAPGVPFVGLDVEFPERVADSMLAVRARPGRLPFADRSFDTVLCLDVLEHVPRPDRAGFIVELGRVAARRVIVACPSSEAQHLDDYARQMYAGRELPSWLAEHYEHVLPTPEEIADFVHAVDGFEAQELPQPNGLLTAALTLADLTPHLGGETKAQAAHATDEWVQLCQSARFGSSWRKAWLLERTEQSAPLVDGDPSRLEDTALAALRCPACDEAVARTSASALACGACERDWGVDDAGAWHLDVTDPAAELTTHEHRFYCEPDWHGPQLARVLHTFLDRDESAALLLRAAPERLTGSDALTRAHAALGGRELPDHVDIVIVDAPLDAAAVARLRAACTPVS